MFSPKRTYNCGGSDDDDDDDDDDSGWSIIVGGNKIATKKQAFASVKVCY